MLQCNRSCHDVTNSLSPSQGCVSVTRIFPSSFREKPQLDLPPERKPKAAPPPKKAKPESLIKLKINTIASKNLKGDEERLQEMAEKAELLSHLSEVSEENIFSAQRLEFKEKQATVSLAAQKAVKKLESCLKTDPDASSTKPVTASTAIAFKRRSNANRNIRSRPRDE